MGAGILAVGGLMVWSAVDGFVDVSRCKDANEKASEAFSWAQRSLQNRDGGSGIRALKLAACLMTGDARHPVASAAVSEAVSSVLERREFQFEGAAVGAVSNVVKEELRRSGGAEIVESMEALQLIDCMANALQ